MYYTYLYFPVLYICNIYLNISKYTYIPSLFDQFQEVHFVLYVAEIILFTFGVSLDFIFIFLEFLSDTPVVLNT